jgi:hypothetical protein
VVCILLILILVYLKGVPDVIRTSKNLALLKNSSLAWRSAVRSLRRLPVQRVDFLGAGVAK